MGGRTSRPAKKSAAAAECLGRRRGGMSTKIHPYVEAPGNAVRLLATEGQAGDSPQALPLLADTAYDSDTTRAYCAEKSIEAVIPSHLGRTEARPMDEETCRDRNNIERFFDRLKQCCRLATRYEERVACFLAFRENGCLLLGF